MAAADTGAAGAPGARLPHVWLDRHRSLYDELGAGFTLLEVTAPPTGVWEDEAGERGIPFTRYRLNRTDLSEQA